MFYDRTYPSHFSRCVKNVLTFNDSKDTRRLNGVAYVTGKNRQEETYVISTEIIGCNTQRERETIG